MVAARSATARFECLRRLRENDHRHHILKSTARAGRHLRRRPPRRSASRGASPRRSTMSACWRSRCSSSEAAADAGRQRDRAARAQFRPLDDRGGADVAVRAACARHLPAGRSAIRAPPWRRRDAQPDRRRGTDEWARGYLAGPRLPPSLRQGGGPPRPQDGPRDAGFSPGGRALRSARSRKGPGRPVGGGHGCLARSATLTALPAVPGPAAGKRGYRRS